MKALLAHEPALVGTIVSAALGLALALGVDSDVGAAASAFLTVIAGIWIRASVYPSGAVDVLVHAGAQRAVTDLAAADTGPGGELTTTGEAVARQAADDVMSGAEPPGPKGDPE